MNQKKDEKPKLWLMVDHLHQKEKGCDIEIEKKRVAKVTGISIEKSSEKTRKREYVYARTLFFHILLTKTKLSLEKIGLAISDNHLKDHATVLHAEKNIQIVLINHLIAKYNNTYYESLPMGETITKKRVTI